MGKFSIAALQLELAAEDNVSRLCNEIRTIRRRYPFVHMVLLAELCPFGPDTRKAQPLPGPTENAFADVARETGLWLLPGSLYELSNGKIYNTTPVINPRGEVIARYRKIFPFYPYEENVACGEEFVTFDIEGFGCFGVSICYDMWFPETIRSLVCQGAEVILHPSLTNTIDREAELAMVRANAACHQCYFLDINSGGRLAVGQSIIAGPGGEVIHQAGRNHEIIVVEIDFDHVRRVRERGWHGLGQPLKSFRDNPVHYPAYDNGRHFPALRTLGPLRKPAKDG